MTAAESCTGGLLSHVITQIPKSSDHFLGSVVSYSNAAKEELLDVPDDLIERVGAVSAEVAEAMTAVTGIAGPDGGSEAKPVGLTYVAAALRDGPATVERHTWPHDRDGNKRASVLAALELATRVGRDA